MSIEDLAGQRIVRINGAKRLLITQEGEMPEVQAREISYSEGEVGLISKAYSEWFYNTHNHMHKDKSSPFFIPNTGRDTRGYKQRKSIEIIARGCYKSSDWKNRAIGFRIENGDIPVVLFDLALNNSANLSLINGGDILPNPGYFVGLFREGEFSDLNGTVDSKADYNRKMLTFFDTLMRERFNQIPFEFVERRVNQEEKDALLKHRDDLDREDNQTRSKLADQVVGEEDFS